MQLLVLSNGHGEDAIAIRIIEQLQRHPRAPKITAFPLVGTGYAYSQLNIPTIGQVKQMPSGGFIYMDGRQLWRDVRGGLLQLTLAQFKTVRRWAKIGGKILAVGDIVPLLFAWSSGAEYAFVGTAKSEYYLRDEDGWLPPTSGLERWLGAVYLPWERWLMSRRRCKAVFPRDTLTTQILQQWSIPAFDLGNPMIDGLEVEACDRAPIHLCGINSSHEGWVSRSTWSWQNSGSPAKSQKDSLVILLLPGSRMPEAQRNWQTILTAIAGVIAVFDRRPILFLGAIAPALSLEPFQKPLIERGWNFRPISDANASAFTLGSTTLILSQNAYAECLSAADLAIAMAGTATEQFVGLGKPAIIIPGEGPQFTYAFAEAQTRLLGCSAILVEQPEHVVSEIQSLLDDADRWQQINQNGRRRMGSPGAAARIANCLMEKFMVNS
ncbi:hypothetical protein Ple7327_1503 [Pleurocapsa sp. PCC 7327]|uniref:lipid-A-disaccharide synthase-related protein n=1 Tax=Pleurocapsa sp. PCC 7327 TaxID=118163 RepID=UPI00029FCE05|nr:lipid-A-disaccharide synthase-related protein [Pleurocapsa sp. PCC 7327]AFY76880.1 hypothetical protein Ple7327_1503 [Pleurocapsa sp. PCC 7327]